MNNFWLIMFLILVGCGIFYLITNHITIDFKSFFKRGFKKVDNTFGLYCYVGKQGKGKTYSAIRLLKEYEKKGYTVITNVQSFQSETKIYIANIVDIIDFAKNNITNNLEDRYIIFFDEIFTVLEKKQAINKDILSFISQLRKRNIILITTAQEWSEINITFRRYCRYQIDCNMVSLPFIHTAIVWNSINDGDLIKWDEQEQEFIAPRISGNIRKGNRDIIESYDTFETIKTF